MVDRNLFFIIDNLEKFLSVSQIIIDNVMYIFKIVVKLEKKIYQVSFIYKLKDFRALLGPLPGPWNGPIQVRGPED